MTATRYHLGRNGQVAPCEATTRNCPLGGIHYAFKEEAQFELMDLNIIRNHWRTGGLPGDFGWHCTCGWEPDDMTFSGLAKVEQHADEAHAAEVAEAKAAFRVAQERQAPLLKVGQQVRITLLPDRTGEREVIGRLQNVQGNLVVQPSYYKSDEFITVVDSRGKLNGNVRLHTVAEEQAASKAKAVPADFSSAQPAAPKPSKRVAVGSLRRGDVIAFDDNGELTAPMVIKKVENNDGYNVRVFYAAKGAKKDAALSSTSMWYTTPITRYES